MSHALTGLSGLSGVIPPAFTLTATTTAPGQTVTLQRLTPTGDSTTVTWGDGSAPTTVAAAYAGTVTHVYAAAGTYAISVAKPLIITALDLRDAKLGCVAGEIGALTSLKTLYLSNVANVTVGAGEIGALTSLTYLYLYSLANVTVGAGEIGALTSLTYLILYDVANVTVGAGEIGALTSLTYLYLNNVAGVAVQVAWPPRLTSITYQNSLSQTNVDAVLWGIYQMTLTRTGTNGTIAIATTNAAPSGTFQAAAACPVSAATPGKEIAHELLNDGCGAIAAGETWATVTITE